MLGHCDFCKKLLKYPKKRRLNTMYVQDELNYECSCKSCYDYHIECYEDMWNSLY